jgi:hypothetical protein
VNAKHDGAFTAKEIEEAVKDLPTYKAGDSDELKSELIKAGGTAMETVLSSYSTGWTGEVMPTAWSQGVIVNLFSAARQLPRDNTGLDLPQDVHEHPAEAPGNDGGCTKRRPDRSAHALTNNCLGLNWTGGW